jgi:hypothetical protein
MMLIFNKTRLPALLLMLLAGGRQAQGKRPEHGRAIARRVAQCHGAIAADARRAGNAESQGRPCRQGGARGRTGQRRLEERLARSQSQLAQGARSGKTGRGAAAWRGRRAGDGGPPGAVPPGQRQLAASGRRLEAERLRLDGEVAAQRGALARCEGKNAQLYATGQEILQAYEGLDVLGVMQARQPFAAQSRVRLEQIAQQYGDQLYQGRFDARQTEAAATPAAPRRRPTDFII